MRSCCNQCKFKGISRATDLTLGDFWGYKVDVNEKDYGVSAVMVHSSKGEKILEAVNSLHKELHTIDEIIKAISVWKNQLKKVNIRTTFGNVWMRKYLSLK